MCVCLHRGLVGGFQRAYSEEIKRSFRTSYVLIAF